MMEQNKIVIYILVIGIILIVAIGAVFIASFFYGKESPPSDEPTVQLTKEGNKLFINISDTIEIENDMPITVVINYRYQSSDVFINGTWAPGDLMLFYVDQDQTGTVSNGDYFYKLIGSDIIHIEINFYIWGGTQLLAEADF